MYCRFMSFYTFTVNAHSHIWKLAASPSSHVPLVLLVLRRPSKPAFITGIVFMLSGGVVDHECGAFEDKIKKKKKAEEKYRVESAPGERNVRLGQ